MNSYMVYTRSSCSSKRLTHQQYRQTTALQELEAVGVLISEELCPPSSHNIDTIPEPLHLMEWHFPGLLSSCHSGR